MRRLEFNSHLVGISSSSGLGFNLGRSVMVVFFHFILSYKCVIIVGAFFSLEFADRILSAQRGRAFKSKLKEKNVFYILLLLVVDDDFFDPQKK